MCYREERQNDIKDNLNKKMEAAPAFIKRYFRLQESKKTSNCYWGYIRDMLNWMIQNERIKKDSIDDIEPEDLSALTCMDMMDYFDDLLEGNTVRKNSLESVNTKKNVFKSFWKYLIYSECGVTKNIVMNLQRITPKYDTSRNFKKPEIPTSEQLKQFLTNLASRGDKFEAKRDNAIVLLMLGSGIRSDELIGLDVDDIYMAEKPYIQVMGKGGKERNVKITSSAAEALSQYLSDRKECFGDIQQPALFLSNRGNRISNTAFKNIFKVYSDGKIYPHELRHYVGTIIANDKKLGTLFAKEQLGHASSDTTEKYYIRVMDNLDKMTKKYMKEWRACYGR